MCTRTAILAWLSLAIAFTSLMSCQRKFDKEKFLAECQFSIEDNLLSDEEEYKIISDPTKHRDSQQDSLYRLFNSTHDHKVNMQICRSFGRDTFVRPWGRGTDSLLIDDFFARAIQASEDRDEIIELLLIYGWDKPYSYQRLIGEKCLDTKYYVNDSVKYIALNYAIDGLYDLVDSTKLDIIREYARERMKVAANVFGEDSDRTYNALFQCAQLTQLLNGKETDIADSLFRYHQSHEGRYQGVRYDIFSDPLYNRFKSSEEEGNLEYAAQILVYLLKEMAWDPSPYKNVAYDAEAAVVLFYEAAALNYAGGDPHYQSWLRQAVDTSMLYLSPMGKHTRLSNFIEPDHRFNSHIVDLLDIAYNTPDTEEAYNLALFLKGTSAIIAPEIIRLLEDKGTPELTEFVDTYRQNYEGYPFYGMTLSDYMGNQEVEEWNNKRRSFERQLRSYIEGINPEDVWRSCSTTVEDVHNALKPGESAVEIIKTFPFSDFDYGFTCCPRI